MNAITLVSYIYPIVKPRIGKYIYSDEEVELPAIRVTPPDLPTGMSFKPESGVECLIERLPNSNYEPIGFGQNRYVTKNYTVYLINRIKNSTQTLEDLSEQIANAFNGTKVVESPGRQSERGFIFEQVRITIPFYSLKSCLSITPENPVA